MSYVVSLNKVLILNVIKKQNIWSLSNWYNTRTLKFIKKSNIIAGIIMKSQAKYNFMTFMNNFFIINMIRKFEL